MYITRLFNWKFW